MQMDALRYFVNVDFALLENEAQVVGKFLLVDGIGGALQCADIDIADVVAIEDRADGLPIGASTGS